MSPCIDVTVTCLRALTKYTKELPPPLPDFTDIYGPKKAYVSNKMAFFSILEFTPHFRKTLILSFHHHKMLFIR